MGSLMMSNNYTCHKGQKMKVENRSVYTLQKVFVAFINQTSSRKYNYPLCYFHCVCLFF